jgi:signal transduction histidine kinase
MAAPLDNPLSIPTEPPDPPSARQRWLVLSVCAALLVLLLAAGAVAVRFLGEVHNQELAVTRTLAERTQMLSGLWLSIQSYNQAVQQFVAQAEADRDQQAQQRIDQLTLEIDSELRRYPAIRDSEESVLLRGMQDVFLQQRTLYVTVLRAPPAERRRRADSLLASRTAPTEKQILDWSSKLRSWNGDRLQRADSDLVAQFTEAREGLARALAIASGAGLLLVLASMIYIVRLERQTRARYVELAESRSALQQLSARLVDAQETERRSISRELHDEIGQSLGALLVDIGRLASLPQGDPQVKPQLDHMKSVAERSFQSVRNIALLLRPSMLDDLGLAAALEWLGREVSRSSEIEVTVDSENVPEDLPDEYKICIYRVAQEALRNAVRHSGARNARIAVEPSPRCLVVRVIDDGHGFDPTHTRGLGLLGMEERIKRLGGSLKVESEQGKGANVIAELPFPPGAPA